MMTGGAVTEDEHPPVSLPIDPVLEAQIAPLGPNRPGAIMCVCVEERTTSPGRAQIEQETTMCQCHPSHPAPFSTPAAAAERDSTFP